MVLGVLAPTGAAGEGRTAAAEVGARAEGTAGARHDDGAYGVVGVGLVEGSDELADDRGVDGIEPVGTVEVMVAMPPASS